MQSEQFQCTKCEFLTKSKHGLSIHFGRKHKNEQKITTSIPKIKKPNKTPPELKKTQIQEKVLEKPLSPKNTQKNTEIELQKINFRKKAIIISSSFISKTLHIYLKPLQFNLKELITKILHKLHQKFNFEKILVFGENLRPFTDEYNPIQFTKSKGILRKIKIQKKILSKEIILISNKNYKDVLRFSSEEFFSSIFKELSKNEKNIETLIKKINEEKMENVLAATELKIQRMKEKEEEFEIGNDNNDSSSSSSEDSDDEMIEDNEEDDKRDIGDKGLEFNTVLPDEEEFEINFLKAMEKKRLLRQKTKEQLLGIGQFDQTENLIEKLKMKQKKK